MLSSLGGLFTLGQQVNWKSFYGDHSNYVKLPRHPWQRQHYWGESEEVRKYRLEGDFHPLLGQELGTFCPLWQQCLDLKVFPYLRDHRIRGRIVFPASAFLELAIGAACKTLSEDRCIVEDIQFREAMLLSEDSPVTIQTVVNPPQGSIEVHSRLPGGESTWKQNFTASYRTLSCSEPPPVEVEEIQQGFSAHLTNSALYRSLSRAGLEFGASFQGIRRLWEGEGRALAFVELHETAQSSFEHHRFHPALLDSCLQVLAGTVPSKKRDQPVLFLPERIERFQFYGRPGRRVWSYASLKRGTSLMIEGDIQIYTEQGHLLASITGFRCRRVSGWTRQDLRNPDNLVYEIQWQGSEVPVQRPNGESGPDRGDLPLPSLAGQNWLVFGDKDGLGDRLAQILTAHKARCIRVRSGRRFYCGKNFYRLTPHSPGQMDALVRNCSENGAAPIHGVVHLWSLETMPPDEISLSSLAQTEARICHSLMHLVQSLKRHCPGQTLQLLLVTRGARDIEPREREVPFWQCSALGLGRVIAREMRQFCVKLIDLDVEDKKSDLDHLFTEILWSEQEEVAWRHGRRWIPRMAPAPPQLRPVKPSGKKARDWTPFRLEIKYPGVLDSLQFRETGRRPPGTAEVEIALRAVALNFRDVLKALDLYSADRREELSFGDECAGRVTRVGPGVDQFKVGDEVVAVAPGCFQSFVNVAADWVTPLPSGLTLEEAVTMPIAFLTATYALHSLAQIKRGDHILIHSASGGVGLAAVQIAQKAGARLYATAGSPKKRRLLEKMGIQHVMDSRSLTFTDRVLEVTGGRGVDVVVNSLAGQAMTRSLSCMAPHGRFLELGKRDLYENRKIGL